MLSTVTPQSALSSLFESLLLLFLEQSKVLNKISRIRITSCVRNRWKEITWCLSSCRHAMVNHARLIFASIGEEVENQLSEGTEAPRKWITRSTRLNITLIKRVLYLKSLDLNESIRSWIQIINSSVHLSVFFRLVECRERELVSPRRFSESSQWF